MRVRTQAPYTRATLRSGDVSRCSETPRRAAGHASTRRSAHRSRVACGLTMASHVGVPA